MLKRRTLACIKKTHRCSKQQKRAKALRRGLEQTSQGLRRKRDEVEGPLHQEADKSTVEDRASYHKSVRYNGRRTGFKENRRIFAVVRFMGTVFDRVKQQR
jgi:hypothetical protein